MRKAAALPGIAGNDLNRCEVRALQRKDLEQRLKEQPYSLVDSRLRIVRMEDGGRKRVALDGNKEGFVQKKDLWFAEKNSFLAHAKPPKMKSFFQHTTATTSHCTKANEQPQLSSVKTYCELAVKQLFFEKHRSCVCTTVTLSHRFKAFSPAFCRQNRFRHEPPKISAKSLSTEL